MTHVAEGPESLVGSKLGSIRLERIVGSGGMGTVYLGRHEGMDKDVAVKVLSPHLAGDAEYVQRFIREGTEAGKIDHPNVARVLETDKKDGTYFIVMEYVRGQPLDEVLREEKRLSFQKATRIVRDVAKGLEAAQARGVIHRDIKPANILIDTKGVPKIVDFGLAKQAGTRRGLTVEGLFMGTPEYVSPEQAEGKKVDFRTDIYSLGVTYYQLLTGKYPFMGETDVEIAMKRLKDDPRPVQDAHPGVDVRAIPIVEKMLKRAVAERYQTAKELLVALNPLVQNEKKAPIVPKTATVIGKLPVEVQRRLHVLFASVVLAPAIALFFLAGAVSPGGDSAAAALGALFKEKMSLTFAGLGALALGAGMFIMRRELRSSARAPVIVTMLICAAMCAVASLAMLARSPVEGPWATLLETGHELLMKALMAPVNLMLGAVVLATMLCAMLFEMDDESPRPILQQAGLVVAMVLWYGFAAAGNVTGPIKGMGGAIPTAAPLLVGVGCAALFGILCLGARSVEVRTRKIGAGLYALALVLLLVWGAAGVLGSASQWWGAIRDRVAPLPGSFLRSGATAMIAVGLLVQAVFVMRAGIARTQAFYKPKK